MQTIYGVVNKWDSLEIATMSALASSSTVTVEKLHALAQSRHSLVRQAALRNLRLPEADVRAAFETGVTSELMALLWNRELPADLLERLTVTILAGTGTKRDARVAQILIHKNAPRHMLEMGLASGNPDWVESVAANPALPTDLAAQLFQTALAKVRLLMVPFLSVDVLTAHVWSKERSSKVIRAVLQRALRSSPRQMAAEPYQRAVDQLLVLARVTSAREEVAMISHNPEQLILLCGDVKRSVRGWAAANEHCPDEGRVLAALLN